MKSSTFSYWKWWVTTSGPCFWYRLITTKYWSNSYLTLKRVSSATRLISNPGNIITSNHFFFRHLSLPTMYLSVCQYTTFCVLHDMFIFVWILSWLLTGFVMWWLQFWFEMEETSTNIPWLGLCMASFQCQLTQPHPWRNVTYSNRENFCTFSYISKSLASRFFI